MATNTLILSDGNSFNISFSGSDTFGISLDNTSPENVIGNVADLTTDEKSTIVGAINEVDGHADTNASAIGTLTDLTTSVQTNLVSAINEVDEKATWTFDEAFTLTTKTANTTASGWRLNESDGLCSQNASYKLVKYTVTAGDIVKIVSDDRFQFQSVASVPASGTSNRIGSTYGVGEFFLEVPTGATYLIISTLTSDSAAECYDCSSTIDTLSSTIGTLSQLTTTEEITFTTGGYVGYATGELTADENYSYAKIDVHLFQGGYISGTTYIFPKGNAGVAFMDDNDVYITGYRNTTAGTYKWDYNLLIPDNAAYLLMSLRVPDASKWVTPTFPWQSVFTNAQNVQDELHNALTEAKTVEHYLNNATHVSGNAGSTLTLMHFSDIHGGSADMNRIISDASKYSEIDDMICTGDMVPNTYTTISSWWNENVMTCIGNHDTASYSGGAYNWTDLSMADRDTYYIAPFESNWGITHTSGTSYYYKDYSDASVRLIVMDGMLYMASDATEANAQTSWLSSLLADAITNSLHVLIAIHSPHGGATAENCSFSKYGATTMPTYSDCNTPQTVIDTVASAISSGLKFIGYIVGHTHQDNIWDAENDGTQLMYCVTTANVASTAQWENSDQNRSQAEDAYNIITIDTANTLVKIIRGGGADIDDHMRTRKAICFDYSTGTKVGEIL